MSTFCFFHMCFFRQCRCYPFLSALLMPKCWNWYTSRSQKPRPLRDCEFESHLRHHLYCGLQQLVARESHTLTVAGSSPAPATILKRQELNTVIAEQQDLVWFQIQTAIHSKLFIANKTTRRSNPSLDTGPNQPTLNLFRVHTANHKRKNNWYFTSKNMYSAELKLYGFNPKV